MGGFPALPSGNNPAIAAANPGNIEGLLNRKESRAAAAARQEAAKRQKEHEDARADAQREDRANFEAVKAGGKRVDLAPSGDRNPQANVTLQRPENNPDIPGYDFYQPNPGPTATVPNLDLANQLQQTSNKIGATPQVTGSPFAPDLRAPVQAPTGQGPVRMGDLNNQLQQASAQAPTQPTPPMLAATPRAKGQTYKTPAGVEYYFPTAADKLDETNSFTVPTGYEQFGLQPGTKLPLSHAAAITGLAKQFQATADAADKKKQVARVTQEESDLARKAGFDLPVDTPIPFNLIKSLHDAFVAKEAKKETQVAVPGYAGPTGAPLVRGNESGTAQGLQLPPGSKPALTAEQQEKKTEFGLKQSEINAHASDAAEARQNRRTDAQQVIVERDAQNHEKAGIKKQAFQAMAQGYHDAAGVGFGETYFPPRLVNGVVVPGPATQMPGDQKQAEARKAELEKMATGFEGTAKTHQSEQERIEKKHGWGKFAAPQDGGQAPAGPGKMTPGAPGTATAKPDPLGIR